MARPTKLTESFIEQAEEYLYSWEENGEVIPSIAGLAVHAKVSRDSIHSWYNGEWPEDASESVRQAFSDIMSELVATQELKLLSGGLSGKMNSTITKLILHKHNYTEKVETDHTSSDNSLSRDLNITVTKSKR